MSVFYLFLCSTFQFPQDRPTQITIESFPSTFKLFPEPRLLLYGVLTPLSARVNLPAERLSGKSPTSSPRLAEFAFPSIFAFFFSVLRSKVNLGFVFASPPFRAFAFFQIQKLFRCVFQFKSPQFSAVRRAFLVTPASDCASPVFPPIPFPYAGSSSLLSPRADRLSSG